MKFLLDTMVISEPARPLPDPQVTEWLGKQDQMDLALSVITLGEIERGVHLMPDGRRRQTLEEWLDRTLPALFHDRVIPIDDDVARTWGRLSAARQRSGRPLPVIDGMLAATALTHGLTLVTRNVGDFSRLEVVVLNPWTGETS